MLGPERGELRRYSVCITAGRFCLDVLIYEWEFRGGYEVASSQRTKQTRRHSQEDREHHPSHRDCSSKAARTYLRPRILAGQSFQELLDVGRSACMDWHFTLYSLQATRQHSKIRCISCPRDTDHLCTEHLAVALLAVLELSTKPPRHTTRQ